MTSPASVAPAEWAPCTKACAPTTLDGVLLSELQAIICHAPPKAPSALITRADAIHFGAHSAKRRSRQLSGDVDAIVLQALRKEPEHRYGSVEQLASDLTRFVHGLPVPTRRDTWGYRARKFVHRCRVEVVAGAMVAATRVGGVVATTRQTTRAENERARGRAPKTAVNRARLVAVRRSVMDSSSALMDN